MLKKKKRYFKKKHVVIIHSDKNILTRAVWLGFITVEISCDETRSKGVDYMFASLEEMYAIINNACFLFIQNQKDMEDDNVFAG